MPNILDAWPILLGWPAVVLSVLVAGLGVLRRRVTLLVTAAVLAGPFSLYLVGSSKFRLVGLAPVAAYLVLSCLGTMSMCSRRGSICGPARA